MDVDQERMVYPNPLARASDGSTKSVNSLYRLLDYFKMIGNKKNRADDDGHVADRITNYLTQEYNYDRPLLTYEASPSFTNTAEISNSEKWRVKNMMGMIGKLIVLFTVLAVIGLIAYFGYRIAMTPMNQESMNIFIWVGLVVVLTIIVSTSEIYKHLTHWHMPDVQKYIVRILYMVPLYGISSWLSLVFYGARLYIETIRDFYEAFVIYSFVNYLIELLGGEDTLAETLRYKDAHYGEHRYMLQYFFKNWEMGEEFLLECKWGTLQYVIIKSVCSVSILVLEALGVYCEGSFSVKCGYIYISIALNVSVYWALYCLVIFYHATHEELSAPKNWHPLGKFLCIKGVIFFTFWQSVLIAILYSQGLIKKVGSWEADRVATSIQNVLVAFEMLGFAIAHCFTFTYKECLPQNHRQVASNGADESLNALVAEDFDDDSVYSEPAVIRTLATPGRITDALWSSTVPKDTISDIKRLGVGTSKAMQKKELQTSIVALTTHRAESI
eukprot:CAMPEP_0172500144 /NCGR_PEP_ID=MMETSP1066-20121228/135077_1 /TAXON_ID=671091 /ORGANISM="Coscinodiscus wailesii, Strain CCMP2513" /LENGTH=499 /DNA_ID=CAMNT_0013274231 /DNA_START=174 /DNA_END=1673 /DNA_ORIENTATION=+